MGFEPSTPPLATILPGRLRAWNPYLERRAAAGRVFNPDTAAMLFNQLLRDGESQSRARRRSVLAPEGFEDHFAIALPDPFTVIDHFDRRALEDSNEDHTAFWFRA